MHISVALEKPKMIKKSTKNEDNLFNPAFGKQKYDEKTS
jgi:hypothetical protein